MRSVAIVAGTAGAVLLAASLGGCVPLGGPATMGDPSGNTTSTLCLPVADTESMLVGDFITIPADGSITVRTVELQDARNIVVDDAWVSTDLTAAFGSSVYPPEPNGTWDARVDAEGATLTAGTANVIVLARRTGKSAQASAIAVEYESGGSTYTAHGTMRILMQDKCTG